MRRLKAELKRVTQERDILKEAVVFFAGESSKSPVVFAMLHDVQIYHKRVMHSQQLSLIHILRAHETPEQLVCRLLLAIKNKKKEQSKLTEAIKTYKR